MTVKEAAAYLGCDESQVRRLCKAGTLKARRVGARLWLVATASAEAYKVTEQRGGWKRGRPRKPPEGSS